MHCWMNLVPVFDVVRLVGHSGYCPDSVLQSTNGKWIMYYRLNGRESECHCNPTSKTSDPASPQINNLSF